jgi:hypothetical protein
MSPLYKRGIEHPRTSERSSRKGLDTQKEGPRVAVALRYPEMDLKFISAKRIQKSRVLFLESDTLFLANMSILRKI